MQTQASQPAPNRSLELSHKVYQHLLRAYPRLHREEYGRAMAQLFRDQCRDAWTAGHTWGLAALWIHTLPDLVKTSFIERWSNFNPGKFMTDTLNALRPRKFDTAVFFSVFIVVFLITLIIATAVTFILPESYASTARIKVEPEPNIENPAVSEINPVYDPYFVQTTFEIMQSQLVLSNAISSLNLNEVWGKKYYGGEMLRTTETMDVLKRRMELKTVRNTELIDITIYSEDRMEAAEIANAVGTAYQQYRLNDFSAAATKSLATLENQYQQQASQIAQLDAEKDRLAKQFGIGAEWSADLMKKYQSQLIDGDRTCQALKKQLQQLQALDSDGLRNTLPTVTGDASISDLLGKLNEAKEQFATLTNEYATTDLHVSNVASTINELNRELDTRAAGILTALQGEVAAKQASLEALRASVDRAIQNQKPTAENQPYWDKKADLDQLVGFHNALAAKIDAEKMSQLNPPAMVEFTDQAQPGDAPVKPNKTLNITLGVIAGIFMGAVAGLIAAYIARRISWRKATPGAV